MKRQIALIISMCIISLCAYSQDTLNLLPPTSLQGISPPQTDYIHLTWAAPQDTTTFDSIPAGILGYNIYRDSLLLGFVDEPALEYYDLEVPWAILTYHISAVYDLTYYGFPGETGESVWAGPVTIDLTGNICPLPFIENFTTGLFETNQWIADGTNWRIAGQAGNPAPCAEFSNMPAQTNYCFSLTSEELRGTNFIAGQIFLDYDLKLDDNAATGQEKLLVEVYDGSVWTIITADSANGDRDWELQHVDITDVAKGHLFKIRFTATGNNTQDINNWLIDNIRVYRECAVPLNLQVSNPTPLTNCNFLLEWDEPYDPEPGPWLWINWDDGENHDALQAGEYLIAAIRFTPEQLAYYAGGNLTTIRIFINDPATAITLKVWLGINATNLVVDQAVTNYIPYQWNEFTLSAPVTITALDELWIGYSALNEGFSGFTAGIDAGPAVSGYGDMTSFDGLTWESLSQNYGIHGNWNIQGGVEFDKAFVHSTESIGVNVVNKMKPIDKRGLLGFNIYRDDQLIATTTDTSYLDNDTILYNLGMQFCYTVTALYDDCESGFSNMDCETSCPVGVKDVKLNSAEIYPNPAKEIVTIKVTDDINRFIVYDILGNELTSVVIDSQRLSIALKVSDFDNGIYPIRFISKSGKSISRKLVVFH